MQIPKSPQRPTDRGFLEVWLDFWLLFCNYQCIWSLSVTAYNKIYLFTLLVFPVTSFRLSIVLFITFVLQAPEWTHLIAIVLSGWSMVFGVEEGLSWKPFQRLQTRNYFHNNTGTWFALFAVLTVDAKAMVGKTAGTSAGFKAVETNCTISVIVHYHALIVKNGASFTSEYSSWSNTI